jgi:hypothetical protein
MRLDFGFVSTEDLASAKEKGQLILEMLKGIQGFQIGHFNRIDKKLIDLDH